ncbi:MAG: iron-containing alcohol dehydrogenase [Myxococcales bacterium]|nr:iron-containing alcohol dehydrogenase [Myxococcales bacterium]
MKLADLTPVPLPDADLPHDVVIGRGARAELPALAARHAGPRPLVVCDPDTARAAGPLDLAAPTLDLGPHPHADDATVERVRAAIGAHTGLVAIGSGTINDLCKRAATLAGVPFVVLGTAASMNGYASGIAAILSGGLKTTVPASPARAIVLDTDILAQAPPALARAGLGDLMSKPVSDSDYWLAAAIEGGTYETLPSRIVDAAVDRAAAAAAGIAARDPDAHGALGEALTLSGVAMVVAGSSAPASGGEHLLSHLWDMERHAAGKEIRLHGAQVGVCTLISAALYQRLLALEAPTFTPPPPWPVEEARIRHDFGPLADVVLPQAKKKHNRAQGRLATLKQRWPALRAGLLARKLPPPAALRAILDAAHAPTTLEALDEPRPGAARVLRLARDIRDRLTVLDLGFDLGLLPGAADALLDEAGV